MSVDSTRLPRTREYLEALPNGISSFRGCEVKSSVFEPHVRNFSHLAGEPDLPGPVAELLAGRLSDRPWVPEVWFHVAYLVVRDVGFQDDATFHRWLFEINEEMFDKPLLRNLMRLVSPGLVVMGAAKRWGAFHTGSELVPGAVTSAEGRNLAVTRLKYPEGLFHRAFLVGLESAFLAALMAARARDPRVELGAVEAGRATYTASWLR